MVDTGIGGVSGRSVVAVSFSVQHCARLDLRRAYQAHSGGTQH